ncbi:MAG TPA: RNA polymerase sigma factor [Acidobacteriota bacterium]|jgi:RNA polymerase sigma-70 factor (ECF subfamily)|nr:RNA polymerase sigma factor [Acidobacteriota bacterium]
MRAEVAELATAKPAATSTLADFERWMAAEQVRIYVLCLRLLRNSDNADSATQDTFLKAHRALERNREAPIEEPAKWLTRIAVNTCLDQLRSRRLRFWQQRISGGNEEAILQLVPTDNVSPHDLLFARDIARRLAAALGKLSVRQRAVFILRHEEDRNLEEIGEVLGLDVGTVKAHMARAVRKLRQELRDLYERQTLER